MRAARILGAILVLLLGAGLVCIWVLPGFMDWNRYRANVANLASAALGQPVQIDGRVTLTLLPEPVLTAMAVSVGGAGGSEPVTARELRLRVALGPLLEGKIDARDLVLRGARLRLPWPPVAGALSLRRPAWLASLTARIEDGSVMVGQVAFTGIDATLSLGEANAAYAASGTAREDGRTWRFTARLGGSSADGAATVDVALDGQGPTQGLGATFSGQLAPDGTLGGRLAVRGPDLSQVLPAPSVPFRAEGRLTVAGGLAEADELALEINGSPAHAAVSLRLDQHPRLDLALATSRLDLDAWLPVLLHGAAFPLPVGLDLSAEAAQFSGGLLRRLRAAFELSAGQVTLREASAVLPGDANLRLAGIISRSPPHFEGSAALSAPDLRTTLHWLASAGLQPLEVLPPLVLRNADLGFAVAAEPGRLVLSALAGTIDGMKVNGRITVAPGARLAVAADLAVDRLMLDPWLPQHMPGLAELGADLGGFDADISLTAAQAVAFGRSIDAISLNAAVEDGHLTLRKLDGDFRGVHAQLSGSIGDLGRVSDARLEIHTNDASVLPDLLPTALRYQALWRGPFDLSAEAAGPVAALAVRLRAGLADARLEVQPVVDLAAEKWSSTVTLRHPGAPRLAEMLGLTGAPSWLGDGSLALVAQVSGAPNRLAAESFDLGAGALRASGQLLLERGAGPARLSGRISADTLPLPYVYIRSPEPLPLGWLQGWQGQLHLDAAHVLLGFSPLLEKASATITLADGALHLAPLSGTLLGGAVSGSLGLDSAAGPPRLSVQAALDRATLSGPLDELPIDLTSGVLDSRVDLTAEGYSPAALLATLAGTVHVTAENGTLTGFDLARVAADLRDNAPATDLAAPLTSGSTGFDSLVGRAAIQRGNVTLDDMTLASKQGGAALSGTIDLAGAALDLRAVLHPAMPDTPDVAVRFTGPYDDIKRIPELADVTLWRARAK